MGGMGEEEEEEEEEKSLFLDRFVDLRDPGIRDFFFFENGFSFSD